MMAGGASWAEAWGPGVESGPVRSGVHERARTWWSWWAERGWRPWELVALIVGFIVFWPIGLAFLIWKMWGGRAMCRHGHEGHWHGRWAVRDWGGRDWSGGPRHDHLRRDTGNLAFEEYKAAELERLEKERQRLAEEQKAFAEFLNDLKRAKDREEFDRFMASRRGPIVDNGTTAPA